MKFMSVSISYNCYCYDLFTNDYLFRSSVDNINKVSSYVLFCIYAIYFVGASNGSALVDLDLEPTNHGKTWSGENCIQVICILSFARRDMAANNVFFIALVNKTCIQLQGALHSLNK